MDVQAAITPDLERELIGRQPWMHPFRLAPDVILGNFKYHGIAESACISTSDPGLIRTMQAAYADYLSGDPTWKVAAFVDAVGGVEGTTCLDIASATGRFSFQLADRGADVLGVEIRSEQVEQANLIKSLAGDRFSGVRFEHDSTSADDPSFRAGENYDFVLSMGLLYHLTDPLQHLANVRRLTRRGAMIHTMTHARERGYWLLVNEDPALITKATGGTSWTPHFLDVPDLLHRAGFSKAVEVSTPALKNLQRRSTSPSRVARLLLPGAVLSARGRLLAHGYLEDFMAEARRGNNASYRTYIALT